jgi:hypothetical protein
MFTSGAPCGSPLNTQSVLAYRSHALRTCPPQLTFFSFLQRILRVYTCLYSLPTRSLTYLADSLLQPWLWVESVDPVGAGDGESRLNALLLLTFSI